MRRADDEKRSQIEINRQRKKTTALRRLGENIHRLRAKIRRDLNDEKEKVRLTALVVSLMDKTGSRVGNEESAESGHVGITGLCKEHIEVEGNTVKLSYTGKSGVKQEKQVTDQKIATLIRAALERCEKNSDPVFQTSDGFKIKADKVNRYLADFDVTAKDIRGFAANRFMLESLRKAKTPDEERERKSKFLDLLESVAGRVGHTPNMLRKHYLLPNLEDEYVKHGRIVNIRDAAETMQPGDLRLSRIAMRVAVGMLLIRKDK